MNPLNVPKLCGGDIELGNFFTGTGGSEGTGSRAAVALLEKIRGVPSESRTSGQACNCGDCRARRAESWRSTGWSTYGSSANAGHGTYDPQDWRRTFLPANGGCVYIDLDHLELCLPEVLSARDHVAAWKAMLRIAARAQAEVNAELPAGQRIHVLANNTDGHGNSFGSHLDFLITRRAWENIFHRRLQHLLYLAAYQASSIVFTGQGKVGSDGPASLAAPCNFQISQRVDFVEVLTGVQTTCNRPIVNSRDEALCGNPGSDESSPARKLARLHVIFHDSSLCEVTCLLKVGVMQIVLAMIEQERINPGLILDDPVAAATAWSRDPSLSERARLVSGHELRAVELQLRFLEEAKAFVDAGNCEGVVPEAPHILELWADTLARLEACDFPSLTRRLDWVLKLSLLERTMQRRPQLGWASPEIKHLDHFYSSLDGGLYQACEAQGAVDRVVSDADIGRFVSEPPADTRAYTRSHLLRLAEPDQIDHVDWDEVTFRLPGRWPARRTVALANPLGHTRERTRFLETATLEDALDILGATPAPSCTPAAVTPFTPAPEYRPPPRTNPRPASPKSPRPPKP